MKTASKFISFALHGALITVAQPTSNEQSEVPFYGQSPPFYPSRMIHLARKVRIRLTYIKQLAMALPVLAGLPPITMPGRLCHS